MFALGHMQHLRRGGHPLMAKKRTSWFPNELPSYQDNATYKQRYANETRQINMSLSDSKPSKMIDG